MQSTLAHTMKMQTELAIEWFAPHSRLAEFILSIDRRSAYAGSFDDDVPQYY